MTTAQDMIRGRSNVVTLTNNSGGGLVAGDVCVQDTSADEKVTTTTSANSTLKVFIAAETIASGAAGKFYESGYCPLVNVNASVTRGRFLFTHTVAKQAAENATYGAGAFGKILKSGTTPSAIIYSATAQTSGGAGSDTTAVHVDASGEINGITEKTILTGNDLFIIEDSAAGNVKKKVKQSNLGGGGAPTTTPYVTTAADAGLSAEVVIPGLAGSADIKGAAGAGTSEEFDGSDPFTYSTALTATDTNTTIKSHWYGADSAGTAKYIYKAWAPAGAFDARCQLLWANDDQAVINNGFWIGDSGNNNGVELSITIPAAFPNYGLFAYTVSSGSFTQRGSTVSLYSNTIYLRITRDGSNNFSYYWSSNGLLWQFIVTQNFSLTVARIGFRINSVTNGKFSYMASDWIRTSV